MFRRKKRDAQRFLLGSRGWLVVAGLFLIAVCTLKLRREVDEHVSSTALQPLVITRPNFLTTQHLDALKLALPNHPLIAGNELEEDNFNNTKGWIVKFNLEGVQKFKAMPEMEAVVPFFDRVQSTHANAFVINSLIAEEAPARLRSDAVGAHRDNTVGIRHQDDFFAHQVNVLYVSVPESMEGGQLEVWMGDAESVAKHKAVIFVDENLMVEFKGSALHRVRRFRSPSGMPRISLVLEQYRIPESYYDRTVDFCTNKACDQLEYAF